MPRGLGLFGSAIAPASVKLLQLVEKLAKPRHSAWLDWAPVRAANALLVALMALLLMPPFTNSLPAYSIILLAASMMEEDGVLIWVAYAISAGTAIYLMLILAALESAFQRLYNYLFAVLAG